MSVSDTQRLAVTQALLETDALTPNHDGTPEHYIVEADNVDYLVRTVLDLASPTPAQPDAGVAEVLDRVLVDHEWAEDRDDCNCGHYIGCRMAAVHRHHLADCLALAAAGRGTTAEREAVRLADKNGENCPLCPGADGEGCDYHEGYADGGSWGQRFAATQGTVEWSSVSADRGTRSRWDTESRARARAIQDPGTVERRAVGPWEVVEP